jgi:hypothetical protein
MSSSTRWGSLVLSAGFTILSSSIGARAAVTVAPARAAVVISTQTQQFTASGSGASWSVDNIVGGNSTVGTISSTGLYTPPAKAGTHKITATANGMSGLATIFVTDLKGVFTYHNDNARDGMNNREFALSGTTVTAATFGKLFSCAVDGAVYAQPLWIRGVNIGGGPHNITIVATQHDSVYVFDADTKPCVTYWHANLLDTLHGGTAGEAPVTWNDVGYCYGDIYPEIGITGTPVIDSTTNTIYVVSASESNARNSGSCIGASGNFYHRLHALDVFTGSEKYNAPVTISTSVPGTGDGSVNGMISFSSQLHHNRSGLAEVGGRIYVMFAAHEDATPYHGWVMAYQAKNVQQQMAVFNTTPNGVNGADGGIWMGGAAPAIDSGANIYFSTGNGVFDELPPPPNSDYGDSILRLHYVRGSTLNGTNLSISDYFTPYNQAALAQGDTDLGSGGIILLPNQTGSGPQHLLTEVGKDGIVYLIDRDNMGQYNSLNNDQIVQSFRGPAFGVSGIPAFWHNNLYIGGRRDTVRHFTFNPTTELFNPTPMSQTPSSFGYPGTVPSVSSKSGSQGIVWAIDSSLYGYASPNAGIECSAVPVPAACSGPAILHAYNANNLAQEYWNSSQAGNNRDRAGNAVKFVLPTVANGKVYVGTRTEVDVYGLLGN